MTMVKHVVALVVFAGLVAGCGGKNGPTAPVVTDTGGDGAGHVEPGADDNTAGMVPPEKMDEITRLLDRKRGIVSRCLSIAIDNKEAPKNSRGKITLSITIEPSGKASEVKVIKTTIESKSLAECVIGHVREIQFPDLPKQYPTSYTFAFEAG